MSCRQRARPLHRGRCARQAEEVGDNLTAPISSWDDRLAPAARMLLSSCDHWGAHMKVVTVRDFRDHATEMFRSDDVILVTREGTPAGFFLPWDTPELPIEVRKEVFLRLSEQVGTQLAASGVSETEVLDDFAASRSSR
jgi:hypothetical protein